MTNKEPYQSCQQCGKAIGEKSIQGLCPACLIQAGWPTLDQNESDADKGGFVPPEIDELAGLFPQLEILELIGRGGMGAVYKARQPNLDRLVALKILAGKQGADPGFAERFTREARALAKLSHPNIVAVYDFGHAGDLSYFIMEYVDGPNLREIEHGVQLTPKEALEIIPQICEALQFAHDAGVVHRDIKPENILLDQKGRVKIADFGLAKIMGTEQANFTLTEPNHVMGTPHYMAPEQVEHPRDVDHRADIYSLGVVFYEMLTGELPLGKFAPPSRKVQMDVRLDEVVLRTLEKEPQRRYQQASEVRTEVQTIADTPGQRARSIQGTMGFEYRSQRTLWGLPLVHVTRGIDPATGRPRLARGIIAIGDNRAMGVIAFGGIALGVVAFGGLSVGLLSLGGCAFGLLAAMGGLAVALGGAVGGAAVGFIALGGGAVGYLAYGGGAWGIHAFGGNASDPIARQFFRPWADTLMAGFILWQLPVLALMLGVGVGVPVWLEARKRPGIDSRRKMFVMALSVLLVVILMIFWLPHRIGQRSIPIIRTFGPTTLFEIHQGVGVVAEDLDGGSGSLRPSNWSDMSESQRVLWAQSTGADLMLDDIGEPWNLVTPAVHGMEIVRVDNRLWDRPSIRDLTRALSKPKSPLTVRQDGQWRRYALTQNGDRHVGLYCPITLAVCTNEGKVGLLQITSCVLEPQAITFRWKFLKIPPDLDAILQRHNDPAIEPNLVEASVLSSRVRTAIMDANMAWYQSDHFTAQTQIESVLALEAQLMSVVAATTVEPLWRTVLDQARALRLAIDQGDSAQIKLQMESLMRNNGGDGLK